MKFHSEVTVDQISGIMIRIKETNNEEVPDCGLVEMQILWFYYINPKTYVVMQLSKSKDISLIAKNDSKIITNDIAKGKDVSSIGSMYYNLPPVICNNPRELIGPEKVNVLFNHKTKIKAPLTTHRSCKTLEMLPRLALHITWSPDCLCFQIDRDVIINRLWIWNLCPRTIYLQVCGFWNDVARRGASWICKPKTRFRLASGLKAEVFIKATPRIESPVPRAYIGLQLAVSHMRDNVIGYFVVPVKVKFDNCKQVALAEEG